MLKPLSVILAPALFWLLYHRWKDRRRPEPLVLMALAYLLGIGSGWLGVAFYDVAGRLGASTDPHGLAETSPLGFLLYALCVIGPIEELVKFLPFALVCIRLRQFDEEIDGIVYASAVALGFASYENYLYMGFLEGPTLIARAVASPLTHAMFASIWGYTCGRARARGTSFAKAALVGLGISAPIHGLYDYFALSGSDWVRVLPAGVILVIWGWRMALLERLGRV